ncbi:hypothetical protein MPLSOD_330072 [Mesorhizobium sp. SOD10]|nr:hypothetical protein MPLSOD_330072 [Mesorhizobium sp. SOD10]
MLMIGWFLTALGSIPPLKEAFNHRGQGHQCWQARMPSGSLRVSLGERRFGLSGSLAAKSH